jgi:hypothetical protein
MNILEVLTPGSGHALNVWRLVMMFLWLLAICAGMV